VCSFLCAKCRCSFSDICWKHTTLYWAVQSSELLKIYTFWCMLWWQQSLIRMYLVCYLEIWIFFTWLNILVSAMEVHPKYTGSCAWLLLHDSLLLNHELLAAAAESWAAGCCCCWSCDSSRVLVAGCGGEESPCMAKAAGCVYVWLIHI
jgi:hypothetical protein